MILINIEGKNSHRDLCDWNLRPAIWEKHRSLIFTLWVKTHNMWIEHKGKNIKLMYVHM